MPGMSVAEGELSTVGRLALRRVSAGRRMVHMSPHHHPPQSVRSVASGQSNRSGRSSGSSRSSGSVNVRRTTGIDGGAGIVDLLHGVLERARSRQVWLFFLDGDQRIIDPVMPMGDYPLEPDERCVTADLGDVPFAEMFVERAQMVCAMNRATEFVVLWERLGAAGLTASDRRWTRAVAAAMEQRAGHGTPLRAQLLLHDGGARLIAPEEMDGREQRGAEAGVAPEIA